MKTFTLPLLVALLVSTGLNAQTIPVKTGIYTAYLSLNQVTQLPVHLTAEKRNKETFLVIHNAEERIELHVKKKSGDTLILPFPNFDSELHVVVRKKKSISGYWFNYNRTKNNIIPFKADLLSECHTLDADPTVNFSGKWETYFNPDSKEKEAAVGIFKQDGKQVNGTFLTETGDYRFLQGTAGENKMYLSCFDGTHAFLFTFKMNDDQSISGNFYSGMHYQTNFNANKNDKFELTNSDSITKLKNDKDAVKFQLNDLTGNSYTFPNAQTKNKVVIIQIMGTWCPNCMDETNYFNELYKKYHDQGLEIISIGYEMGETEQEFAEKIKRLKERKNLDFTFLVGGKAQKSLASEQFKMLNEIISFPTSIYIGRDGSVKRIHTGFSGPGTGSYYTEYVEKTNALIEALLAQ